MAAWTSGASDGTSPSEHPVTGSGAGSYQRHWLEQRPYEAPVRDAHSFYLEMLAELGPVGLALVRGPLRIPARPRRQDTGSGPLVPIAAAVLVAYLARAGIDWDWEFPILTLVALGCAGVIVAEAAERPSRTSRASAHRAPRRDARPRARSSRSRRSAIVRKRRRPRRSPIATSRRRSPKRRPPSAWPRGRSSP